jgi:hypothetical protein
MFPRSLQTLLTLSLFAAALPSCNKGASADLQDDEQAEAASDRAADGYFTMGEYDKEIMLRKAPYAVIVEPFSEPCKPFFQDLLLVTGDDEFPASRLIERQDGKSPSGRAALVYKFNNAVRAIALKAEIEDNGSDGRCRYAIYIDYDAPKPVAPEPRAGDGQVPAGPGAGGARPPMPGTPGNPALPVVEADGFLTPGGTGVLVNRSVTKVTVAYGPTCKAALGEVSGFIPVHRGQLAAYRLAVFPGVKEDRNGKSPRGDNARIYTFAQPTYLYSVNAPITVTGDGACQYEVWID